MGPSTSYAFICVWNSAKPPAESSRWYKKLVPDRGQPTMKTGGFMATSRSPGTRRLPGACWRGRDRPGQKRIDGRKGFAAITEGCATSFRRSRLLRSERHLRSEERRVGKECR